MARWKTYSERLEKRSSERIVKDYLNYNAEARRVARQVLRKRGDLKELNMDLKIRGRQPVGKAGEKFQSKLGLMSDKDVTRGVMD
jgi:hypothetical protein